MSDPNVPYEQFEPAEGLTWWEALKKAATNLALAAWKFLMILGTLFWILVEYADIVMDFIIQRLEGTLASASSYQPNWGQLNYWLGYVDVFFPVNEFFTCVTFAFSVKATLVVIKWVRNLSPVTS